MIQASTTKALTSGLPALAAKINNLHSQCEESYRNSLEFARRAGELLLEAKSQLAHGQWLHWIEENTVISPRTAQVYMRLARNWHEFSNKYAEPAHLTIEAALKLLTPETEVLDGELLEPEEDDPQPPYPVKQSTVKRSGSGASGSTPTAVRSRKRSPKFSPGDTVRLVRAVQKNEKPFLRKELTVLQVYEDFPDWVFCRTPIEYCGLVPFKLEQLELVKPADRSGQYLIHEILWTVDNLLEQNQELDLISTLLNRLPLGEQVRLAKTIQDKLTAVR